ncbi:MAG: ORF3 [Torque teno virus AZ7_4]|nr:MAG: ORF3 [Torque teno virus AZ7_4]
MTRRPWDPAGYSTPGTGDVASLATKLSDACEKNRSIMRSIAKSQRDLEYSLQQKEKSSTSSKEKTRVQRKKGGRHREKRRRRTYSSSSNCSSSDSSKCSSSSNSSESSYSKPKRVSK